MPKVIVPIGFDGNVLWVATDTEPEPSIGYEIVTPKETVELAADEYRIWQLIFADPAAASRGEWARTNLVQVAALDSATSGMDVPAVIEQLIKYGVAAEYDTDDTSAVEFVRSHRLHPSADAMGNSKDELGYFRIGREGRVLLQVTMDVYVGWLNGPYHASMWDQIENFCAEVGDPLLTAEQMAQSLACALPGIVTNRCGFVQQS